MRYSGSEKAEIIKLVEQSSLSVRQTLDRLDIRRSTFYNWLGRYDEGGLDALEVREPSAGVALSKVPMARRDALIDLTLEKPDFSPRELAVSYTDDRQYFVSELTKKTP